MAKRPGWEQHFCADRAYDAADVHQLVTDAGYTAHIKHRRRRNEPLAAAEAGPGEHSFPARRWVVERTLGGWPNGAVSSCAGARKRRIGWPWCSSPVPIFCVT